MVRLLTDSATDINAKEAEELGITLMSMVITFGEEEYLDGVDLLPVDFYNKLEKNKALPKTSQVNAFRFEEEFENLTQNGDEVIAITISSSLSGTYNSALQAAERFGDKVYVVDSLNAAIGQRLLCLYALRLIKEGKTAKDIVEKLEVVKKKIHVIALVDTLKYLKLGGRLSGAAAFVGTLMSIKPLVAVIDGEVRNIGKSMGFNKAISLLNTKVEEIGVDYNMPYGYVWSGNNEENITKYKKESEHIFSQETPKYILGGTIGTHIGPGAVGVAFFEK